MLPDVLRDPLRQHLEDVRHLHETDVSAGFGRVVLPGALERKYPQAPAEWLAVRLSREANLPGSAFWPAVAAHQRIDSRDSRHGNVLGIGEHVGVEDPFGEIMPGHYHGVNATFGYPAIEIRSPREVLADE